jgi:archaellum component FlaG (FlaF/FlaG flagellin family)
MKRFFLLVLVLATIISCDVRRKDKIADDVATRTEQALKDSTNVQIIDTTYNFGKVTEGEKVTYSFRFKNVGKKPLVITKTTASCGCTVPEKPEQPILPGESGFIKVVFNSDHKVGHNEKSITVMSNANPAFPPLLLIGEVVETKK